MKTILLSVGLVAWFASLVSATALTYKLSANERACFYAAPERIGSKIAFYFAVQSGGSFDIDYEVFGPSDKVILDGEKERQGDFVFTANEMGEYKFCFNNEMSTYSEKFVDFEIAVEDEVRAQIPVKQGSTPEQTSVLEESIYKISGQLSTITRNQKYFRTRENRNFSTVRSTEGRIVNFSLVQCMMMICMGALQVFIVRFFFQASLAAALPKPKYTGEDEDIPLHAQERGVRIVGPGQIDESQIVLRRTGPPKYGQRASGWRPRSQEDFGDGGAFPEIPVAQYPLDMGKKGSATSNALAVQVGADGKVKYDAIAKRGHSEGRIVHASFKDLIPLRQRADAGEIDLQRPSEEQVAETTERTKNALAALVTGAVAAQKPKNVNTGSRRDPTFVRYTPANQMGNNEKKNERLFKIVERQKDPMEPPKFKHKKIPRGPPSPPPPIMHSPPRKLTAEDQEMWKIPPPVSNWKNPKGFTVPLDKRLAADGRGLQDIAINDKFAQFSEALFMADRHAREEVRQRALMQQRLAEKEKAQKEENLRMLAQKAREERAGASKRRDSRDSRDSRSRSRSYSQSDSGSESDDSDVRAREKARQEKRREEERKLRQSRMGAERRIQVMAREQNRDISEKIALGLAKPTQQAESMYDSRLFNQTSGFDSGINEDNPYDKPLFAAQDAINSIYRPSQNMEDYDDEGAGDREMAKIQKTSRFGEALGRGTFKGTADAEAREGPVQFERETAGNDPFQMDKFMAEVDQSSSSKRGYGLQDGESRQPKRARVEDDEDD
ncbi:SKIP/SNW domain-containing protein [Biscogniauxia marginata]|nr:SKIP/SNW domain-containing protein [Biscogniauxia marginata]